MTYSCPVCGIADQNAYLRCYDGGCPDGRDQARNSQAAIAERNKALHAKEPPSYYTTPPNWRKCMNYREDGPTPCWHPHCGCFNTAPQPSPTQHNPWTMLLTASIIGLIVALLALFGAPRAHALDHGFDPTLPTTQWFEKLMRPDMGEEASCCGKGDAYPVSSYWQNRDKNGTPTGTWTIVIGDGSAKTFPDGQKREYIATGTEVQVYDGVVNKEEDDLDNPTDTSWVFMDVRNGEAKHVYCFIRHPSGN